MTTQETFEISQTNPMDIRQTLLIYGYEYLRPFIDGTGCRLHLITKDTRIYVMKTALHDSYLKHLGTEFRILSRINDSYPDDPAFQVLHDVICRPDKEIYGLITERVTGQDLYFALERELVVPYRKVFLDVVKLVHKLHQITIVHGDIKLENVMYNSKTGQVTLIDFGGSCSTLNPKYAGTPGYISHELILYQKDKSPLTAEVILRAESYAIGCTMYSLMTRLTPETYDSKLIKDPHLRDLVDCLISDPPIDLSSLIFVLEGIQEQRVSPIPE